MENTKTEWEISFDEQFLKDMKNPLGWLLPRITYYWEQSGKTEGIEWEYMEKELKDFISSTIKAREREVISDILKLSEISVEQGNAVDVSDIEEYAKGL